MRDPEPRRSAGVLLLVAHLAVVALALVLLHQPVSLDPTRNDPAVPVADGCEPLPHHDDLVHMTLRTPDRAAEQAQRWIDCEPTTIERARDAIRWDHTLIAVVMVGLAMAVVRGFRRTRWRWSARFALAFLLVYVITDIAENRLLSRYLDDPATWSDWLRWITALKFGAFLAVVPMFVVSLVIAFGDVLGTRRVDPLTSPSHPAPPPADDAHPDIAPEIASPRVGVRAAAALRGRDQWNTPPAVIPIKAAAGTQPAAPGTGVPTTAVACSGGGIRSAAFNLGALQALDTARASPPEPTEMQRVGWISAVSGGSYLAAAWVSARADEPGKVPPTWSRGSKEEDHLRRHASYLAPGFSGKVWAFLRFALGFLMNVILIVLAVAAVAFPYGWVVGWAQEPVPSSGGASIRFAADGAQIRLASGAILTPIRGEEIRLAGGETAWLRGQVPVVVDPAAGGDDAPPQLPAAKHGRKLANGTQVLLAPRRHPVEVEGRVLGCIDADECTTARARYVVLGAGSDLVAAPRAVLTIDGDAIVQHRRLIEACGAHACERVANRDLTRAVAAILLLGLILGMVAVAVRPRERLRATSTRAFRVLALVGIAAALAVLVMPELVSWAEGRRWSIEDNRRVVGVSLLTIALAAVAQIMPLLGSGSAPSKAGKMLGAVKTFGARLRPLLIRLAVYVAAPVLLLAITLFIASHASQREIGPIQVGWWLALLGPLLIVGAGADLNQWSLHPYYRERLVSAFGVRPEDLTVRPTSWLERLPDRPELVVCAAANVSDGRVTSPGRPVVPWVFSRDEVGARSLERVFETSAVVPARDLTDKLMYLRSLWTSVAVSGAAFSPSMGKMTRPERGLMAIGNVRLGVWYPNPAMLVTDPAWYQRHHPTPWYLAKEALGIHKATDRWVYVTDGGHYENLGLVELLRRGARQIYCFDASGDAIDSFGTMAEAMRLAREELGIEIGFRPDHLEPDDEGVSPLGVTAATITVRTADGELRVEGWLVFAKLEVPATAAFDIVDLARTLPKFPNHPTSDQLYTDQKFEAYRALGHHLGTQAAGLAISIRAKIDAGRSIDEAVAAANAELEPPS